MTVIEFFRVLQRRKWLVLVVVLCAFFAFLLREVTKPSLYKATSQVLLNYQSAANLVGLQQNALSSDAADRYAETQKSLARVPEVAQRTLDAAGVKGRSASDLLAHSSVATVPNQDLLEFSVTDGSPRLAMRLATEYGRQFPIYRRELDTASLQKAQSEVQSQLARTRLVSGTDSPLYKSLSAQLEQLKTLAALQTTSAQLVQTADRSKQVQPRPTRAAVIGLFVGLLAAIAFALIRDATDTRLRSPNDITDALDLPLLARIPPPPSDVYGVVSIEKPRSVEAESFRILRTNLEFSALDRGVSTIMVTSALAGEGKSTTTANLAVAIAKAGKRVTVVDLDLRRPGMSRLFAMTNYPGITDVVMKKAELTNAMQLVFNGRGPSEALAAKSVGGLALGNGSLHLVGTGELPANPGEFIASRAFAEILQQLKANSDVVLIDAAPLLAVADTMALTDQVEGVLLVVRRSMARRSIIGEMKRVLEGSRAPLLGVAITDVPALAEYEYYGHDAGEHKPEQEPKSEQDSGQEQERQPRPLPSSTQAEV